MRWIAIFVVFSMISSCVLMEPRQKKKKKYRTAPAASRNHNTPIKKTTASSYGLKPDPTLDPWHLEKVKEDLHQEIKQTNWQLEDDIKKQREISSQ